MNTIKHLAPLSISRTIFSIVLFLFSCYLFFSGTLFGLVLLGAALKLGLQEGIEMDLSEMKYRKLYSILQIRFGAWKPIPEIEYVSIFKTTKRTRSRVITAESNNVFEVFKVNLFYDRNKHIEAFVGEKKEAAFKVGTHIATLFDVEVHDAT